MFRLVEILLLMMALTAYAQNRAPPGVNPQHYQDAPQVCL